MDLTLFETLPLGDIGADRTDQYLPLTELRRAIEMRWTLTDTAERTGGPARYAASRKPAAASASSRR
ncbi:cyclic pyranopterin phosphate synthase [Faunimonas pinastri]|uniref:Cyclic pyranopterin phosphate synthase n=1 Tax=Faunimonas pinastri TaxID=1855383 RepID=A0A1H9IIH6_9HYPH|nr:cyclic pyranopterin phosphate synthase [Faunimonas pinastri]